MMISKPCPDHKKQTYKRTMAMAAVAFLFAATSLLASSTHHFEIQGPEQVRAGDEVMLSIQTVDIEGNAVSEDSTDLVVTIYVWSDNTEEKIYLMNGKAELSLKAEKQGPLLVEIRYADNERMSGSWGLIVDRALPGENR